MTSLSVPFANAYWVLLGQILAGEHPLLLDPPANQQRIHNLLALGVTLFVDLTEAEEVAELGNYLELCDSDVQIQPFPVERRHFPIRDMDVPSRPVMHEILDTLDQACAAGRVLYIHCWGGIGRTGTVIGCYLVRHGRDAATALRELADMRAATPDYRYAAPARDIQRQLVQSWLPNE